MYHHTSHWIADGHTFLTFKKQTTEYILQFAEISTALNITSAWLDVQVFAKQTVLLCVLIIVVCDIVWVGSHNSLDNMWINYNVLKFIFCITFVQHIK